MTSAGAAGEGAEAAVDAYLSSLEPIGWRFGLDRMRRLSSALGMPQHRFASIHVVGTNGKSSVATMTAALLEAHGLRTGAYLSPHEQRWAERVTVGGAEIAPAALAAAIERVAQAAEAVNRTLEEGESVTQFEAITAAAFVALAAAGVQVGVIEAGLGGRLDATNVLPSKATVLTSIGLEHTQYLGETTEEIAAEKLAVLRDHSTLVLGRVPPRVEDLARRTAAERHARVVTPAGAPGTDALSAPYLRRNFDVARAAAETVAGPLDPERVRQVAAGLEMAGRMEVHEGEPMLVLDAAHNPDGARALAEALPGVAAGRPVVACVAVLSDKDASGIVAALAPRLDAAVCTELPVERLGRLGRPGAATVPADELGGLMTSAGVEGVEAIADPARAAERTLELAVERTGVALACGSHYLLQYATDAAHRAASARG